MSCVVHYKNKLKRVVYFLKYFYYDKFEHFVKLQPLWYQTTVIWSKYFGKHETVTLFEVICFSPLPQ